MTTFETYIEESWQWLLRDSLEVAHDPKVSSGKLAYLYISPDEDAAAIAMLIEVRRRKNPDLGPLEVRILPDDLNVTQDHGILYLPHPYIVPGGRFNEMYAWDSYWIILGLLQGGRSDIARGMVENFIYQIRHYGGKILNANRTYYLTRSQPPLLTLMAMAVLPSIKDEDRSAYLQKVAGALSLEYDGFWKQKRYDPEHGLFHYGDSAQGALGPCPEVLFGERDDNGLSHYDRIAAHLKDLPPDSDIRRRFLNDATGELTTEAIAGDRAMRESGFDASMHMGPYGLETPDYNPVCLNSLLYTQCILMERMYKELGQKDRADYFKAEAAVLRANINKHMWNEEAGLFCNFNRREKRFSSFAYLTAVYPLWAGLATPEQARRFHDNLALFEAPFGIMGTRQQTGCQWDAPFMWAPLVYFAVAGLHAYGFADAANRVAQKFVDTVRRVFDRTGANFEKYNADTGNCETTGIIDVGYTENVVGFGWTNGTAILLQKWLQSQ